MVPTAAEGGPEEPITVAHIVVEATSLAEDISHAPDLVGKPAGHGSPSILRDCLMADYNQGWRISTAHILHSPKSQACPQRGRAQALCEPSPRQSFRRRISSHYALLGRGSQDTSYCPEYLEAFGNLGGMRHHELVSLVCIWEDGGEKSSDLFIYVFIHS